MIVLSTEGTRIWDGADLDLADRILKKLKGVFVRRGSCTFTAYAVCGIEH